MATEAQKAANRKNALRSTGPITPKGKEVSSRNSVRHGVLSNTVATAEEDRAAYNRLLDGLVAEFDPRTEFENLLVERLSRLFWRERRLVESERAAISDSFDVTTRGGEFIGPMLSIPNQLLVGRYQTMLTNQIASTIIQLRSAQHSRQEAGTVNAVGSDGLPPARPRTRPSRPANE